MERVKVIYILSLGHSGSTILDLILGSHPALESAGELRYIRDFISGRYKDTLCTCGLPFSDCKYWKRILEKYSLNVRKVLNKNEDIFNISGDISKLSILEKLYLYSRKSEYLEKTHQKFMIKYYYLSKEILKYSKKEYLVDSSKNPFYAYLLYNNPFFDVKIIHLFRDLRGNIESIKRKKRFKYKPIFRYYQNLLNAYISVFKGHIHIKLMIKRIKHKNLIKVRYKELCTQTEKVLKKVSNFLDIEYVPEILSQDSSRFFGKQINHNIGGNRVSMGKIKEIRYLQKWPKNLSRFEKICFLLMGGWIINKIG